MKKIILALVAWFLAFGLVSAYQPTDDDLLQVDALQDQLTGIIADNNEDLRSFYSQIRTMQKTYTFDERIDYILTELNNFLWNLLQTRKQEAKVFSKEFKQIFLDTYIWNISTEIEFEQNCVWRYNTLDNIAFAHDYPTALLISTRYRETNCGYYLPANTRGPFQITSKNYGTGKITEDVFFASVIDFINFSKNKYSRYENINRDDGLKVELNYTEFTFTGIVRHSALYNGLSGYTAYWNALPLNLNYVWDGYTPKFTDATRYGTLPQFLKILEWELTNKY